MNKILSFIIICFTVICLTACGEESNIIISEFNFSNIENTYYVGEKDQIEINFNISTSGNYKEISKETVKFEVVLINIDSLSGKINSSNTGDVTQTPFVTDEATNALKAELSYNVPDEKGSLNVELYFDIEAKSTGEAMIKFNFMPSDKYNILGQSDGFVKNIGIDLPSLSEVSPTFDGVNLRIPTITGVESYEIRFVSLNSSTEITKIVSASIGTTSILFEGTPSYFEGGTFYIVAKGTGYIDSITTFVYEV